MRTFRLTFFVLFTLLTGAVASGRAQDQQAFSASTPKSHALHWSPAQKYDQGDETTLAAHPSGLILEAHQTHTLGGRGLWYHVGTLNGTSVTWGGSQGFPWTGFWPNVAISKEGYVIFVYSNGAYKSNADLFYAVGKIEPYGTVKQSITWLTPRDYFWDAGFHSSIAMNDNGVIVGVHETGSGGTGLYYRIGHLKNPAGGDYTIQWDSGEFGIKYDDGVNPHIALNNRNEVVEVHQVTGENLLHYRRGTVSGGTIHFAESHRYDSNSSEAAVALLDSGFGMEVHRGGGADAYARTGTLSLSNPERVEWSDSIKISDADSDASRYPAVATDGTYVIGTWTSYSFDITGVLYYSVARIP